MNSYKTINDAEFRHLIQTVDDKLIAVLFTTEWLGEGCMMDSLMRNLALEFGKEMEFYRIDISIYRNLAEEFGVYQLPAVLLFEKGSLIDKLPGMRSRHFLENHIRNLLYTQ